MQSNVQKKHLRRQRRKKGIRKGVFGTPQRPRLSVFRSINHVYAQIIDDLAGRTLVASSSIKAGAGGSNVAAGAEVGKQLAQKAKAAGIKEVAFDRNGFRFHGRIKALAEAARKEGLTF
jgi:large subunit ribosomal protein L18